MRVLTVLTEAIAETVIEAIQKEVWTAFIDNTFAFTNVAFKNKQLVEDFKAVEANPQLLEQLKNDVLSHRKVKEIEGEKAGRIFNIIWMAIVFNSRSILEIKSIVEE